MAIFGIDVSRHQGDGINWRDVASSGISFMFARASLALRPDETYALNVRRAREAGLIVGAYHFLYPSWFASPERQADVFMAQIGDPEGLLIALDVEKDRSPSGLYTYLPDEKDAARWVARFRERYPDHPLLIYTGGWYWKGAGYPINNAKGSHLGLLWASRYIDPLYSTPQEMYRHVPSSWWTPGFGGWNRATILQFTSSAVVPGVRGRVDANAFAGGRDELRRLAYSIELPDTATEDFMELTLRKGEEWTPARGTVHESNGVLRRVPDRGAEIVERLPLGTVIRSAYEVRTNKPGIDGDWRLTSLPDGTPVFFWRPDFEPVVPGGDPKVDAVLGKYLAGVDLVDHTAEVETLQAEIAELSASLESEQQENSELREALRRESEAADEAESKLLQATLKAQEITRLSEEISSL